MQHHALERVNGGREWGYRAGVGLREKSRTRENGRLGRMGAGLPASIRGNGWRYSEGAELGRMGVELLESVMGLWEAVGCGGAVAKGQVGDRD